jgi:hypothetical protein
MGPKDVVRTLDQQTSEIRVASFGDAELRISFTGLAASWSQAEIAAHITTSLESVLVAQGKDEGESSDLTNALDRQQGMDLGILGLSHLLDLTIVVLDLGRHLRDLLEHRAERRELRLHTVLRTFFRILIQL